MPSLNQVVGLTIPNCAQIICFCWLLPHSYFTPNSKVCFFRHFILLFLTSIFSRKFPLQFLEPLFIMSSIPFRVPQMLYTSLLTKTLDTLSLLKLSLSPKACHPLLQQLTLLYVQTIYSPHLSFTQCFSSPSTITLF